MTVIEASAPGRCGIIGNPTDIYGGRVLSCSVPARATCRLTLGVHDQLPDDLRLWDAATARFPIKNVKVEWSSEIPKSSGLAGSTALLAATLACVMTATGHEPALATPTDRIEFAELLRDVELNEAGVVCGYQDAYMITHGGLQAMDFKGKHPIHSGPYGTLVQLSLEDNPFLLVTTGVERLSGSVHGPMRDRWLAGDSEVVDAMAHLKSLANFAIEAFILRDWDEFALAMTENQRVVSDLGGSGKAIDSLIQDCLRCGAMAAKLAGAGMGGTVIALAKDVEELSSNLDRIGRTAQMRPMPTNGVVISQIST